MEWLYIALGLAGFMVVFAFVELYLIYRIRLLLRVMLSDHYKDNIYGMIHSMQRAGVENIVELSLRSERGKALKRPLGTARKLPDFSGLAFDQPNLAVPITPVDTTMDMKVTIGPRAKRPLTLDIPLLIGGMGYGVAVSFKTKIAWAKGASAVGTATNTGEGAYLPEERQAAAKLIVQLSRTGWMPIDAVRQADAVEIQIGQGASGATGHEAPEWKLRGRVTREWGIRRRENVINHSHLFWQGQPWVLRDLVPEVRRLAPHIPVGVKIGAGCISLERDLEIILENDVDFITIDGMNAATSGEYPILEDDFGLPTILALLRAIKFFNETGVRGRVSLIISGGLLAPGDCLKAIALGADAVGMGTGPLFAAAHDQGLIALPWEPIGAVNWYVDPLSKRLKISKAAKYVENFLKATTLEMEDGLRAIGKTSLKQLTVADLRSITVEAYQLTGITPAFEWVR
ncbi:MAG TPA: FMN-binding glutamate synthase family protein [Bacillota bacterium]|nr:FMN-binding glutamate synthase family protein [Bacillota bacterium]